MRPELLRKVALVSGVAVFSGWLFAELAHANARLTATELASVVGGIDGCTQFSQDLEGYKCSNFRSMSCELICSPCAKYSINQGALCGFNRCWKCGTGGNNNQIKECAASSNEADNCAEFGEGPQYGVCGFQLEAMCQYNAPEDRCFCPQPVDGNTGLSCPRKDCMDF